MATTNPPAPDPMDQVISVSTTEIGSDPGGMPAAAADSDPSAGLTPNVGAGPAPGTEAGAMGPDDEVVLWEDRYAFGNFFGRSLIGGLLILGCLYLIYEVSSRNHPSIRPLVYLLGIFSAAYWLWLAFRIFRARLSHYYRLTTRRLLVSSGIFQSRQDILELEHLKEVSIQQSHFLSHLFKIATVVVASNVNGAPTLFLVGIKDAQRIVDLIYFHARK